MFLSPFIPLENRPSVDTVETTVEAPRVALREMQPAEKVKIVCVTGTLKIDRARITGEGIGIVSGPLDQSKAYFEVLVEQDDTRISLGGIGRHPNTVLGEGWVRLQTVPNTICLPLKTNFSKNTKIGVFINLDNFPPTITAFENDLEIGSISSCVRGDLWPAIEICGSATICFNPKLTQNQISRGIQPIMLSRSII